MKIEQIIFGLIKNNSAPVDFAEINNHLYSNNLSPNKTTVYRNLDKLEKEGMIKKVILSDHKQHWELTQTNFEHQHYHLICQKCEKIECQELELDLTFKPFNFKILKTELNLYGFCQNCI